MIDTSAEHRETIRRLAAKSLAHHQIDVVGQAGDTMVYRFAMPGRSAYAVRILIWPGWICVAGDTGDTLFRHSSSDSISWLRGSVSDVRYMLGKVQGARKAFNLGDALAFMRRTIAEDESAEDESNGCCEHSSIYRPPCVDQVACQRDIRRERLANLREWVESAERFEADANSFHAACAEAEIDDPPSCQEWDSNHVWAVEILRHFVKALDAKTETEASRDRQLASEGRPRQVQDWPSAKSEAWRRWPGSGFAWIDGAGKNCVGLHFGSRHFALGTGSSYAAAFSDADQRERDTPDRWKWLIPAARTACPACDAAPEKPCSTGGVEEQPGVLHLARTAFTRELAELCGCGPINLTGEPHKDACPARDGGVALFAQSSSGNDDLGARVLSAVREWLAEAKPRAPESIYQMDRVVESLPSLAERVCGVVGYYSDPNEASVTQTITAGKREGG